MLLFDTLPCVLQTLSISFIFNITFHYIALLGSTAFYDQIAFATNFYYGFTFYLNMGLGIGLTAAAS